jgi:hypothetical protein
MLTFAVSALGLLLGEKSLVEHRLLGHGKHAASYAA